MIRDKLSIGELMTNKEIDQRERQVNKKKNRQSDHLTNMETSIEIYRKRGKKKNVRKLYTKIKTGYTPD